MKVLHEHDAGIGLHKDVTWLGPPVVAAGVVVSVLPLASFSLAFPGRGLSLPVIAVPIGAATLGKLPYSAEKAVARRLRSRRAGGN